MGSHTEVADTDARIELSRVNQQLGKLIELTQATVSVGERAFDLDTCYSWAAPAGGVVVIGPIPRTIRNIACEFTSSVAAPGDIVALLSGNVSVALAAGTIGPSANVVNAMALSGGNTIKFRDTLDGSGYLTVYNPSAAVAYGNIRVRSLDNEINTRQNRQNRYASE